jgi:hypothetical protein
VHGAVDQAKYPVGFQPVQAFRQARNFLSQYVSFGG